MIATVRIAPVKYWCEHQKDAALRSGCDPQKLVGTPLEIDTSSLGVGVVCGGKVWDVAEQGVKRIATTYAQDDGEGRRVACEHVLEMD